MPFAEIYTALVLPVMAVWVWSQARANFRRWTMLVTPGAVTAVVLGVVLQQQSAQLSVTTGFGPHVLAALRGVFFLGPRNGGHHLPGAFETGTIAAVLAGVLLAGGILRRDHLARLLMLWAFGPMLVVLLVSVARPGMFGERYFAFCAPGLVLAIARSVEVLRGSPAVGRRGAMTAVVGLAVLLLPLQANQRLQDTKAGDDYRRLVATMPAHRPQAVWFDSISARSVPGAYPASFTHVEDVRLRRSGSDIGTLWGTNVDPAESTRRLTTLRPTRLLVVYGRSGLTHSSGAVAARTLHCSRDAVVPAGRYSFAYFTCR